VKPWYKEGYLWALIAMGVIAVTFATTIAIWGLTRDQACRDSGGVPTRAGCLRHEDFQPIGVVK
jgi:hypothetical protein